MVLEKATGAVSRCSVIQMAVWGIPGVSHNPQSDDSRVL